VDENSEGTDPEKSGEARTIGRAEDDLYWDSRGGYGSKEV